VARGIVTEEVLAQIHKRLEQLLVEEGASLDRIYYCPYHPDGAIPKYRRDSDLRKPNPGMLLEASRDMEIDLAESWMVGNDAGDVEAGSRAGCKTILLDSRGRVRLEPGRPGPDYRAVNLKEVVNIVKMHNRSAQKQQTAPLPTEPPITPQSVEEPQQQIPQQPIPQQPIPKEESPQQQPEPQQPDTQKTDEPLTNEQLLQGIFDQLKLMRRTSMFGEFSTSRLIAGIIQGLVFFCLLVSIWFLMSPAKELNPVLISLGFAILLQIMALTFYVMSGPK
jgi:HAD superfamily hydrolase (TIGR01662 family)